MREKEWESCLFRSLSLWE